MGTSHIVVEFATYHLLWIFLFAFVSSYNVSLTLCSLTYENGSPEIPWHSDDEVALGSEPIIVSLSLGAPRQLLLRKKKTNKKVLKY